MQTAGLLSFTALALLFAGGLSCGLPRAGDEFSSGDPPPPGGRGDRIHEIRDPASPQRAAHKAQVSVTSAVVVAIDTYDETRNGKSSGTIYVSDLGSRKPYSGISLYNPSFMPGNLHVSPGDALDLRGVFQENQDVPILFAPGAFLVQLANPIGTFRFEASVPEPVDIDVNELANYDSGSRWLNMLVRVSNVTVHRDAFGQGSSGRISSALLPDQGAGPTACDSGFPKAPTLVNELMDLEPLQLRQGTVIRSLTGVVTFFCNLHIAPRSAADIVL